MRNRIILLALSVLTLMAKAEKKDWVRQPYGPVTSVYASLNALDVRDQHRADIEQLLTQYDLLSVEIITASDDYWYYSLQSKDGRYGVANQQGQIVLQPIYDTCNYCPYVQAGEINILAPVEPSDISSDQRKTAETKKAVNSMAVFSNYVPSAQPSFLVSQNGIYDVLDTQGNLLQHDLGNSPIYYSNYLMTGINSENIRIAKGDGGIKQLVLDGLAETPMRVFTSDGHEISLPEPIINGNSARIVVETPFVTPPDSLALIQDENTPKGTIRVSSDHPKAKVKVDGNICGQVPMTLELLGEHTITVEDDYHHYYRGVTHLTLTSQDHLDTCFVLRAMPLKTHTFALLQYGLSTQGYGAMVGVCKQWGAYAKVLMKGKSSTWDAPDSYTFNNPVSPESTPYQHLTDSYSRSYSAGAIYRVNQYLFPYLGAGYAAYTSGIYEPLQITPARIDGMILDLGIIVKWHMLLVSAGYTPMIVTNQKLNSTSYGDWHLGIGINIHKNRKR